MPAYHINIRSDSHIADSLDVEAESPTDLRLEMASFVGELLKDHAGLIWADEDWRVELTDSAGLILYVIRISASEISAAAGSCKRG
jgi:hypothetical protein